MVQGSTFLSLPTWRQASESWLQKRPPGRNLGEHRLVQHSGTTSRGTALNFLSLCEFKALAMILFTQAQYDDVVIIIIGKDSRTENKHFRLEIVFNRARFLSSPKTLSLQMRTCLRYLPCFSHLAIRRGFHFQNPPFSLW